MGVSCSASDNVFFIQVGDSSLVLKSSLTVASDMFSSMIMKMTGIQVPATKLVCYLHSNEWDPMVSKLWALEGNTRGSKLAKTLLRPFLLLCEYLHGHHLHDTPKDILHNQSILRDIGRVISVDLLLNQWDRFPCGGVWNNEGNPNNILFMDGDGHHSPSLRAIDNNITSIDPSTRQENFLSYKNKVEQVLREIISHPTEETAAIKVVRNFILQQSTHDIGEDGSVVIQEGVMDGVKIMVSHLTKSEMEKMKMDVESQIRETLSLLGVDDEHVGFSRINISFLDSMLELFKQSHEN